MKKVVLKLDLHDDKHKQKAMKTVSGLSGVDSVALDMKEKKLTVTGDIDPVCVVSKLRKFCPTQIVSVGPAKEEKKAEPKKEQPKQENKDKDKKDAKQNPSVVPVPEPFRLVYPQYQPAYHPQMTPYYFVRSAEEDPNACVIC